MVAPSVSKPPSAPLKLPKRCWVAESDSDFLCAFVPSLSDAAVKVRRDPPCSLKEDVYKQAHKVREESQSCAIRTGAKVSQCSNETLLRKSSSPGSSRSLRTSKRYSHSTKDDNHEYDVTGCETIVD